MRDDVHSCNTRNDIPQFRLLKSQDCFLLMTLKLHMKNVTVYSVAVDRQEKSLNVLLRIGS